MENFYYQLLADVGALERFKAMQSPRDTSGWISTRVTELERRLNSALGSDGLTALLAVPKHIGIVAGDKRLVIEKVRLRIIVHFNNPALRTLPIAPPERKLRRGNRRQLMQGNVPTPQSAPRGLEILRSPILRDAGGLLIFTSFILLLMPRLQAALLVYAPDQYATFLSYGIWMLCILLYLWYVIWVSERFGMRLKKLISAKQHYAEDDGGMANYIAAAFGAGVTIIVFLLAFDYYGHMAAADYQSRKEAAQQHSISNDIPALLRVSPPVQHEASVESGYLATVGPLLGTFGDFFGGVLNPILTFGTLLGLAITIMMQRAQLIDAQKNTKDSAAVSNIQTFETTFFNLLTLHTATVGDLRFFPAEVKLPSQLAAQLRDNAHPILEFIKYPIENTSGRAVFATVVRTMFEKYRQARQNILDLDIKDPSDVYRIIQERHNDYLGHYFRNMYQLLSFVEEYPSRLADGDGHDEHAARKRYTNILRAQLSAHELTVLFYNCGEQMVDSGEFRELVIEYEMLEHMAIEYCYDKHSLLLKGFTGFAIHDFRKYFEDGGGKLLPGAFGANPQIAKYLTMREMYQL